MQNSTKALLWVFLVFLIGTAFGAAVVELSQRSRLVANSEEQSETNPVAGQSPRIPLLAPDSEPGKQARPPLTGPGLRPNLLQKMLSRLHLSADQEARAREILEQSRREYATLQQRHNLAQRRVRQQALHDLSEILDPVQRRRLRQFFGQLQQRRPQPKE